MFYACKAFLWRKFVYFFLLSFYSTPTPHLPEAEQAWLCGNLQPELTLPPGQPQTGDKESLPDLKLEEPGYQKSSFAILQIFLLC